MFDRKLGIFGSVEEGKLVKTFESKDQFLEALPRNNRGHLTQ